MRRTAAVLLASALLSGSLTACALVPNAQRPPVDDSATASSGSARSADDAAASVEGIAGVSARIGRGTDGSTPYLSINVELDDTFTAEIGAPGGSSRDAVLLDYVLGQVWSQNEVAPADYVTLAVSGAGRTTEGVTAALAEIGISAIPYAGQAVSLKLADLEARYGTWPGEAPALPPEFGGPQ